jgi:hypothetical protein
MLMSTSEVMMFSFSVAEQPGGMEMRLFPEDKKSGK